MSRWMRQLFTRPVRQRPLRNRRLRLTSLEERMVPTLFTVLNTNDNGAGSFRQALLDAAADVNTPHTIDFDSITFASPQTITLNTGQLVAGVIGAGSLTINGPAVGVTLQQTTANSRVMLVTNSDALSAGTFEINNMTFRGGSVTSTLIADRGAGIGVASESLTLNNCVITANTTAGSIGGVGAIETGALTVIKINNSTISNNSAAGNSGGVRFTTGGSGEINNSVITGNVAGTTGGGFYAYRSAAVSISDSTISNNRSTTSGGGVRLTGASGIPVNATITRTAITGNTGTTFGGALYSFDNPGAVVISQSLVANNRTLNLSSDGGGLRFNGANSAGGSITIENTTVANNRTAEYGGGVSFGASYTGSVSINFSTIANNTADVSGGGVFRSGVTASTVSITLDNSVIANNVSPVNPDFFLPYGTITTADRTILGVSAGVHSDFGTGFITGGASVPLGLLSNNGGPTQTMLPAPFGLLTDAGSAGTVTLDQRGNNRVSGLAADIGAAENSGLEPVAVLNGGAIAAVDRPGGTSYTVAVTYYDATNVKFSSLGTSNIVVTGPAAATVTGFSASTGSDAKTITVTYTITPPGGSWDTADNGSYTISLANNVENTLGAKIPGATIGTLSVQVGNIYTVANTNATGAGSLAQAVTDAMAATPNLVDLVQFDPVAFATPQTITLNAAINVSDHLVIQGTGRDNLTIRQAGTNRLFAISDGVTTKYSEVTIENVTLRDGAPSAGTGGAIQLSTENLTLRNVRVTNNKSTTHGGAIASTATGSGAQGSRVTITNSIFTNNQAGVIAPVPSGSDGGIYYSLNSLNNVIWIRDSVLSGNTAGRGGSAVYVLNGAIQIENSQITGNLSASNNSVRGGAVAAYGSTRSISVINSTIADNRAPNGAGGGGGGLMITGGGSGFTGFATVVNTTITGNTASKNGGGVTRFGTTGAVSFHNSIVAGNLGTGLDANLTGTVNFFNSAIGTNPGTIVDVGGNFIAPFEPILMTPLYDFGGGKLSSATIPNPASPNVGRDSGKLTNIPFDVRGAGFARVIGVTDMGSLEFDIGTPIATITPLGTISTPDPDYSFTVTYFDEAAILASSINGDEILVTGPGGFSQVASLVGAGSGTSVYTQTYKVNAPGGAWDFLENGDYTVTLLGGKATDTGFAAVPQTVFGQFTIFVPPALVVTNTNDSGTGSLREAFLNANKVAGATTITFDPVAFATAQTITLTSGAIAVTNKFGVTLTGTTAANLAVSGNGNSRVFFVDDGDGTNTMTFNVTGMTIRDGREWNTVDNGGAVASVGEALVFTDVNFINNVTHGDGGAVGLAGGSFTWTNGLANNNRAVGPLSDGGFLVTTGTTAVTVTNSTVSGNFALDGGGGFYVVGTNSSLTMTSSTVSGNTAGTAATAYGGGIYMGLTSNLTLTNTTVSSNVAGESGGGIRYSTGTVTLIHSTVANNIAMNNAGSSVLGGGGIFRSPGGNKNVDLFGSIVANNLAMNFGSGNDIQMDGFVTAVNFTDSAVGDAIGFLEGTVTGFKSNGTPIVLGPLANNGGPSLTHLPVAGSVVRDAGTPAGALAYTVPGVDQRNVARPIGAAVDLGAVESDGTTPTGVVSTLTDVNTTGGTNYQVKVTYFDSDLNIASIDGDDLTVVGPAGALTFQSVATNIVPGGVEATYTFSAPGGTWDTLDSGVYVVNQIAGKVTDATVQSVAPATLGQFRANFARNWVVTNTNDSGPGSFRQAVINSNAIQDVSLAVDTISFDPGVFGTAQTITLTTGEVIITDNLTIQGTSAKLLTISTAGRSRHLTHFAPGSTTLTITDLTLANGKITGNNGTGDVGGSIVSQNETVDVRRVAFINNSTGANGGAYNWLGSNHTATFTDTLFFNNFASGSGGALRLPGFGTVTLNNVTLSGNTGVSGGGAISNNGANLFVNNSTIVNNRVTNGGGLGGGLRQIAGTADLNSVIIANNTSAGGGPDISDAVAVSANYSIVGNGTGMTLTFGTELQIGVDPLINPLADNGGPTQTHSLKAGSPAFDTGINGLPLAFDQRGTGFVRTYDDPGITNALGGDGTDIGAFERQAATASKVTSVVINAGQANLTQRSRVTALRVNFDNPVTFNDITKAFTLTRDTMGSPSVTLNTVLDGSGLFVTITFTGGEVDAPPGNQTVRSLVDGKYTLTGVAAEFANGLDGSMGIGTNFVLNSTSYVGGVTPTPATGVFRLFGDSTGDGFVNADDFLAFRLAFLTNNDVFDFDGINLVDTNDFLRFRLNFLKQI